MNQQRRITLSTESVNRYGYRVLTDGIRLEAFLKNPVMLLGHNQWSLPIGRWDDVKKENGVLSAVPVFDENDEVAKAVKMKYESGFLFSASIGFNFITTSSDPKHLLPNQTGETVIESDLMEASFVSVPGNTDATLAAAPLCLSAAIPAIASQPSNKMDLTKINTALGLAADAPEDAAVAAITKLNTSTAAALAAQADALIETGKANGLVNADNEPTFRKLAAADFDATKALLSVKKVETPAAAAPQTMTGMLNAGSPKVADLGTDEETFEKLQKTNPTRLLEIAKSDPERYKKLAAGYATAKTV